MALDAAIRPRCRHRVITTSRAELSCGPHVRALFDSEPEILGFRSEYVASGRTVMPVRWLHEVLLVDGRRLPAWRVLSPADDADARRSAAIALALVELAAQPIPAMDSAAQVVTRSADRDALLFVYLLRSGVVAFRDEGQHTLFHLAPKDPHGIAKALDGQMEIGAFFLAEPGSAHEALLQRRQAAADHARLLPVALGPDGTLLTDVIDLLLPWQDVTLQTQESAA